MKWHLVLLCKLVLSPFWFRQRWLTLQQPPAWARKLLCSRSCPPAFSLLLFGPGQLESNSKYNSGCWKRPLSSDGDRTSMERNLDPDEGFCYGSPLGSYCHCAVCPHVCDRWCIVCRVMNIRSCQYWLCFRKMDTAEDAWYKVIQRRQFLCRTTGRPQTE